MKHGRTRAGEGFRRYAAFTHALQHAAGAAADEMYEPDWPTLFVAARQDDAAMRRAPGGLIALVRAPWELRRPLKPVIVALAAIVAVLIAGIAIFSVQEIELQSARSFLRRDTTQLVNAIVGSPLYSTLSPTAGSGILDGSSLFETGDPSAIPSAPADRSAG